MIMKEIINFEQYFKVPFRLLPFRFLSSFLLRYQYTVYRTVVLHKNNETLGPVSTSYKSTSIVVQNTNVITYKLEYHMIETERSQFGIDSRISLPIASIHIVIKLLDVQNILCHKA